MTNFFSTGFGEVIAVSSYEGERLDETQELPSYSMVTVSNATDNFTSANKIGQGGFGSVYKVIFPSNCHIYIMKSTL